MSVTCFLTVLKVHSKKKTETVQKREKQNKNVRDEKLGKNISIMGMLTRNKNACC